jgi:3-isopropylmalate/(R)-2-methylmalate dehydratase small subunit
VSAHVDLTQGKIIAQNSKGDELIIPFELNPFDRDLVIAGGWLAYADKKY